VLAMLGAAPFVSQFDKNKVWPSEYASAYVSLKGHIDCAAT